MDIEKEIKENFNKEQIKKLVDLFTIDEVEFGSALMSVDVEPKKNLLSIEKSIPQNVLSNLLKEYKKITTKTYKMNVEIPMSITLDADYIFE